MIFRLGGVDVKRFKEYWGEDTISPDKVGETMKQARTEKGWKHSETEGLGISDQPSG